MEGKIEKDPRGMSRRSFLRLGTVLGAAAILEACGAGQKTKKPTVSPSRTPAETLVPTQEPPTLVPTATKEAVQEVPCEILPQQYCSQGKLVDWTNSLGVQWKLVALSNLEDETPIYAPFDGSLFQTEGPGNLISPNTPGLSIYNPDDSTTPVFILTGDIKLNSKQYTVKKGDVIARTQNTGIKVFDNTIVLTVTVAKGSKIISDENLINIFLNKK